MKTKTNNSELGKRSAHTRENHPPQWRGIFFAGPKRKRDRQGKEKPEWQVFLGNREAAPVWTVYHVNDFSRAESLANAMSRDRDLELISNAQPA